MLIIYCRFFLESREDIEVSYYAAEIIAHLACETNWESCISVIKDVKNELLKQLGIAIKQWIPPEEELVIYKSFKLFIELLNSVNAPEVQLFAVWAIHHACVSNGQYILLIIFTEITVKIKFYTLCNDYLIYFSQQVLCDA